MATTYDRLVKAGAPEIAEPYFYRITETEGGDLRCAIRKRRQLFGSDEIAYYYVIPALWDPENVLRAVARALTDAHVDAFAAEPSAEAARDLVGEYSA